VVALRNRKDADSEWRILSGPFADGGPNPRLCPHDDMRQHWLVMRVSRDGRLRNTVIPARQLPSGRSRLRARASS
jgi:hypothetical protein